MPTRVGLRVLGNVSPSVQERVVADLAGAGLAADSDPQDQRQVPGGHSCLVIFDQLTGEVFEELRMTETWGRHRVLAIALPAGSLPDSERPESRVDARTWWQGSFEKAIGNAVACGVGLREIGKRAQDTAIAVTVAAEGGSLRRASLRLGVTERALQMRRSAGNLTMQSGGKKGQVSQPETVPRPRDHPDRPPGQVRVAEAHRDEEGGEPWSSA